MADPISQLGFTTSRFIEHLGRVATFGVSTVVALFTPPVHPRTFLREIYKQGVLSLVIILVCGVAVGMVLGLQGYHTLVRFGAQQSLGALVGLSLIRELGPVLTALLVTGRAGSATTAELATMVATEQLDGLRMLSIDPLRLVVAPKAFALALVMPLLAALFISAGIFGGYLVGVGLMHGDAGNYISSLQTSVDFRNDVSVSLLKSLVFGMLLALISTYRGYTSEPTSEGVSAATTSTVVVGSVTVLLADYVLTALWGV